VLCFIALLIQKDNHLMRKSKRFLKESQAVLFCGSRTCLNQTFFPCCDATVIPKFRCVKLLVLVLFLLCLKIRPRFRNLQFYADSWFGWRRIQFRSDFPSSCSILYCMPSCTQCWWYGFPWSLYLIAYLKADASASGPSSCFLDTFIHMCFGRRVCVDLGNARIGMWSDSFSTEVTPLVHKRFLYYRSGSLTTEAVLLLQILRYRSYSFTTQDCFTTQASTNDSFTTEAIPLVQ
jgi:hypothetical protein